MLAETELDKLNSQLSDFTVETKARQNALDELISSYGKLLEDYRSLRSDYEEEKESREKYKKLARGQERNPFVLVLVDGDGYIFEDGLIKAGSEGGIRAASLLNAAIKDKLLRFGREFDDCRIMVRMYTNLAGLSKALARAGLIGNESRSMAPFCASFTRAHDLFDFVDAGDKKENADFKIREMFRLFAENGQCKHIFFAGCHDTGYLSMLTPYIGRKDRISLIRGSSFSPEFKNLGFNVDNFHGLFRNNPLEGYEFRHPSTVPKGPSQSNRASNGYIGSPPPPAAPVCVHFIKGTCKFGNTCKKSHSTGGGDSWRSSSDILRTDSFMNNTGASATRPFSPPSTNSQPYAPASVVLPRPSPDTMDLIPLNRDGCRLDFYLQAPNNASWIAYQSRAKAQKPCNEFQLTGHCRNGTEGDCGYDHSPLPEDLKHVLKTIVHDYPCGRKGSCRQRNCNLGHICYREGCRGSSGKGGCRLNRPMHSMDPNVARWVSAESASETEAHSKDTSLGAPSEDLVSEQGGIDFENEAPTTPHSNNNASPPSYSEPSYVDELE